jgi:FlaA1/EpsC-like NDP-sugar epimerase
MNILNLIGRNELLFTQDIGSHEKELSEVVSSSRFLVIGGAGSIGQAVTKEILKETLWNFMLLILVKTIWRNWLGPLEVF